MYIITRIFSFTEIANLKLLYVFTVRLDFIPFSAIVESMYHVAYKA